MGAPPQEGGRTPEVGGQIQVEGRATTIHLSHILGPLLSTQAPARLEGGCSQVYEVSQEGQHSGKIQPPNKPRPGLSQGHKSRQNGAGPLSHLCHEETTAEGSR